MGYVTQQGENAGKELFYKSKLSLTPKRKVASYVGRLCEEGKFQFDYFSFASQNQIIYFSLVIYSK